MDDRTIERWLDGTEPAPDGAPLVRAFLAADDPAAAATGLAEVSTEVQRALLVHLAKRADGPRLALLQVHTRDKLVRKEAGKAIHALRSRGVKVDEVRAAGTGVQLAITPPDPPTSWLSVHDGTGQSGIVLGGYDPAYGRFYIVGLESDTLGLKDAFLMPQVGRKDEAGIPLQLGMGEHGVAVPAAVARAVLKRAERETRAAGYPMPEEWYRLGAFVEGADETLLAPPVAPVGDWRQTLAEVDAAWLADALEWYPDMPVLLEAQELLVQALTSELVIDEAQRRAHVERTLDRQIERTFDAKERTRFARRCRRYALVTALRGLPAEAAAMEAAAAAIADPAQPAAEHPLVRRIWRGILRLDAMIADAAEAAGAPLPTTPDDDTPRIILP